jgi:hypothetical protein
LLPPLQSGVKLATAKVVGPVKVELAGVMKSTWNFHKLSEFVPKFMKNAGSPLVGRMVPSMSDGNRLATLLLCWKQSMVAVFPASIALRFAAQASAPKNMVPAALNILKEK